MSYLFAIDSRSYLAQSCHEWALAHVREYAWIVCALAPNTPIAPSDETMGVLRLLHSLVEVDLPPFVNDFHHKIEVNLDQKTFIFSLFVHHVFFQMALMYELLQNCFVQNDFMNFFYLFFEVCEYIVWGHVPPSISFFFLHLDSWCWKSNLKAYVPSQLVRWPIALLHAHWLFSLRIFARSILVFISLM